MFRFDRFFLPSSFLFRTDDPAGAAPPAPAALASPAAPAATPATPAAPSTPAAETPPAAPATPRPHEEAVPYDRFQQVNAQRTAAEAERDRLQAELTQIQRQGMPDLDRVRAERDDAVSSLATVTRERDDAVGQVRDLTRGQWVRSAAQAARFHDPEDAVLRTDLSTIETEQGAQRHVQELAARQDLAHLIRSEETPSPSGGDLLQRVLDQGRAANGRNGSDDTSVIPADQLDGMTADQLVVLQESDPALYERSLRAAARA